MSERRTHSIQAAELVLPCADLDATLQFFTIDLGFRLNAIYPADDPRVAVLSGHGLHIRLDRAASGAPGRLRLSCDEPAAVAGGAGTLTAPNGTRIELVESDSPLTVPPLAPSLVVTKMSDRSPWKVGRAGMRYRDLIPDRQGGRFIASHIRIPDGGPVPDHVHHHRVRFQMIYCYRGWVRVVYEDQGPPFVLRPGDCVVQPPGIRHRVLESSTGLEVIEIGCPAEHETLIDHDLALPTRTANTDRDYGGQCFVRHVAEAATWRPWRLDGFEFRDTGAAAATQGLASIEVARRSGLSAARLVSHRAELLFLFVLAGQVSLSCEGREPMPLSAGDAVVSPAGLRHMLAESSLDLQLLQVTLPAALEVTEHEGSA